VLQLGAEQIEIVQQAEHERFQADVKHRLASLRLNAALAHERQLLQSITSIEAELAALHVQQNETVRGLGLLIVLSFHRGG
jgi:UTP-glucose-1-phosphate uridylyltransferase